jgi:NADPH-dependent 2,4-dienoyl-CoA reductase/sulfur reductase-like enzyme
MPHPNLSRVVVVGGSLAAHRAACALRSRGYAGEVIVLGAENHAPYDRFPLSKAYLARQLDRTGLDLAPTPPDVTWRLGATATGLDLQRRVVRLEGGECLAFEGLVVASGARPRDEAAGVSGVFTLRTVDDSEALRHHLDAAQRSLVVVGGGLIGAELASTAVHEGHDTTLIDGAAVPSIRALGLPLAEHLLDLHRRAGTTVLTATRGGALVTADGAVTGIRLGTGAVVPADTVVLATGTVPNVDWLSGSGLATEGGLHCTATLHAVGAPRDVPVVAAGDVILAPHALLAGQRLRVESWAGTLAQADTAVANLLGEPHRHQPWVELPTYATTIHGARIRIVGYPQVADTARLLQGSIAEGRALLVLGRGDRALAVVSLDEHDELPALTAQLVPGARIGEISPGRRVLAPSTRRS